MKRTFGRLWQKDDRDRRFLLVPDRRLALTRNFRFWYPGAALDQGAQPACVGYSSWKWLYSGPVKNRKMPFTALQLYKEAQKWDEWPGENYDGTSVRGAFKFLAHEGYVSEYRWAFDVQTILDYVLTVGPIVMGTSWYSGMMDPDRNMYVKVAGIVEGGHAYLFVGANRYRKNPDGTVGAFRILNSWGSSWGAKGRAWIGFDDVGKLMAEPDSEACAATEITKIP
jgi:hypothetical protein